MSEIPKILRSAATVVVAGGLSLSAFLGGSASAETSKPKAEPSNKVMKQGFMGLITIGDIEVRPLEYCPEINGDSYCVEASAELDKITKDDITFVKSGDKRQMTVELHTSISNAINLNTFSKADRLALFDTISDYFGDKLTLQVHEELHAPNTDVTVEPFPDLDL